MSTTFNYKGIKVKVLFPNQGQICSDGAFGKCYCDDIEIIYKDTDLIVNYKRGIGHEPTLTKKDLPTALWCVLSDCECLIQNPNIEDFLCEFGYNECPDKIRLGKIAYDGCMEEYNEIKKSLTDEEILNLIESLRKDYDL